MCLAGEGLGMGWAAHGLGWTGHVCAWAGMSMGWALVGCGLCWAWGNHGLHMDQARLGPGWSWAGAWI
jgi:hypothetical protein